MAFGNSKKKKKQREQLAVTPLLRTHEALEIEHEEQQSLKEQYHIEREDIIVVEKKSAVAQILKAFLGAFGSVMRIAVNIIIIVLAIIGLSSILYPNIRRELIGTFFSVFNELRGYFSA